MTGHSLWARQTHTGERDVTWRSYAAEQDAALAQIQSLCTEDEFREYRHMIGRSMGAMFFEIISPIVVKYPELKPAQLK
jgi:hypothetical protein